MVRKQFILEDYDIEYFVEIMNKIDNNYRHYKKEWCLNVQRTENNRYIISASNRYKYICTNRHDFQQLMKKMYIYFEKVDGNILITQVFKYPIADYILIKLIPLLLIGIFTVLGILSLVYFILDGKVNFWILYLLGIFGFASIVDFIWIKDARKLEIQRCQIIEEVLQKSFNFSEKFEDKVNYH